MAYSQYKRGEWKAFCDRCGTRYFGSQLRKEWTGLMVCQRCWEPRNQQDFLKGVKEKLVPAFVRPGSNYPVNHCSLTGHSALADFAESDCAAIGNNTLFYSA